MLTTTFKLLRKHDACKDRYAVLRKALKGRRDNEPIGIVEVLDHNGLYDALWALRAVPDEQAAERDKLARLFACWCVRQIWHLLTDDRSRTAVEVAERYAVGDATLDDMAAARAGRQDRPGRIGADMDIATLTRTIKTVYPCCKGPARLRAFVDLPRQCHDRTCPNCRRSWDIERKTTTNDKGKRRGFFASA